MHITRDVLIDNNEIWTHNHLVRKWTLNHLAKLTKRMKQAWSLKLKWQQQDSNLQPLSSQMKTPLFSRTGQSNKLCCEYLLLRCI